MTAPIPPGGGLAWPPHPHDPSPPVARPVERTTRKKLDLWDRTKFALLGVIVFAVLAWNEVSDNPLLPVSEAVRTTVRDKPWLIALIGLEVLRQVSFLVAERSAAYNTFWSRTVFGGINDRVDRIDPWMRYRLARACKVVALLLVLGALVGAITGKSLLIALFELPSTVFGVLPMILQFALILLVAVGQFVAIFWFLSRGGVEVYFPDDIKTRFSDVWGQDPVLERVKESMVFLERPKEIEDKGGYVPGGVLLWGPPGTGKTLIAEAVAGETGKPFVFVDPGAFINMFIGVGVLKVKALFRKLRKLALRYGGVIVFFDEADTLGNRGGAVAGSVAGSMPSVLEHGCNGINYASSTTRQQLAAMRLDALRGEDRGFVMGGMGMGGGGMGTLQALLTELSGLKKPRGFWNRTVRRALGMKPKDPPKYRMLVMMATNLPDVLDPALLRPGRIDRIYHVGYPSADGRERTFKGYLDKVSHNLTDDQVRKLAVISTHATGASIKDIVNEALVIAIREGRHSVTYQDMIRAKHLKTHGPADDWTYSDWEGHAVAVHEACHAVAMYALKKREAIDVATIERRGETGGFVAPVQLEEQFVSWRSELDNEVMTFLASLAGERLFFEGDNSQGVGGDLRASTALVTGMLGYYGMGDSVISLGATPGGPRSPYNGEDGIDRQFSQTELGRKVDARLHELLANVSELLQENRVHVLAVAHALEVHKTISGDDIVSVIEGLPGPVVDGARYHDVDARSLIEAYHAAVVRAMKDHGRVALPLPALNGYRPVDPSGLVDQPVAATSPVAWPTGPSPSATPPPPGAPRFLPLPPMPPPGGTASAPVAPPPMPPPPPPAPGPMFRPPPGAALPEAPAPEDDDVTEIERADDERARPPEDSPPLPEAPD